MNHPTRQQVMHLAAQHSDAQQHGRDRAVQGFNFSVGGLLSFARAVRELEATPEEAERDRWEAHIRMERQAKAGRSLLTETGAGSDGPGALETTDQPLDPQRLQRLLQQSPEGMLKELLAVLHSDGGHYLHIHGFARAVADAEARWYAVNALVTELQLRLGAEDCSRSSGHHFVGTACIYCHGKPDER